ncbi:MAG: tetratricopeptide repeat protein [Verrucomicrobia bacterium]|nr:MAG: tetratricopeptide repeat protein [Verrucomicrobiota bacterium]
MSKILSVVFGLIMMIAFFALTGWLLFRSLKKTDDPGRLIFKWVLTLFFAGTALVVTIKSPSGDMASAFIVPIAGAVCGLCMGIIWAPNIGAMFAKPITSLYDGGDSVIEARAFYSIARARRQQGLYEGALLEVENQLLDFPTDYEGWMLKGDILAHDLHRLPEAVAAVEEIIAHGNHLPKNIAYALNQSADWQIKYNKDSDAARELLQRIIELLPDSQQAHLAAQRIAHLASLEFLQNRSVVSTIALKPSLENFGLLGKPIPGPSVPNPEDLARQLVQHLAIHPRDNESREQLSAIYADHYQRLDLARDQLDHLITSPHQTDKDIVRWLNQIADLHIKMESDLPAARGILTRIIAQFPKTSHASIAEMRIARLAQEFKAKAKSREVKLGSYEQNIGLKSGRPVPPS